LRKQTGFLLSLALCFFVFLLTFFENPLPVISHPFKEKGFASTKIPDNLSLPPEMGVRLSPKMPKSESARAIEQNQDCGMIFQSQVEPEEEFFKRQGPVFFQKVGSWFFQRDANIDSIVENSTSGNFLLALAKAGLLDGISTENKNNKEALEILNLVHADDPRNSAPLLYIAYLQHQLQLFDEEASSLKKILSTDHYNSYIPGISRDLYLAVKNPSDFLNVLSIVSQLPIPSYGGEITKYIISNKLSTVGEQMLQNEYRRNSVIPDIESMTIETFLGRHVLLKIEPGQKDLPTKEWLKGRIASLADSGAAPFTQELAGCSLDYYWPVVRQMREALDD
jgi:hypothetical protein